MPASKEMSLRDSLLHEEEGGIDWAQAHSICKALDGTIQFIEPYFDPAASKPSIVVVRINQHCSLKQGSAIVEISGDNGERDSGETEDASIVLTQLDSASGQPSSLGNLLRSIDDPAKYLASGKTVCSCGKRRREIWIKFDSLVEQTERFVISLPVPFVSICPSTKIQVVGVEAFGRFAP